MKYLYRITLISLIAFTTSCTEGQRTWLSQFFKGSGSAVPVAVEKVNVYERDVKVIIPATLAPSEQIDVRIPHEANIDKVLVNTGDLVKAGDTLCTLSVESVNLRLASLRAELREAQANLEKNQYFLRNRDRLLEENRIDRNQYDNLDTEVSSNEATVEKVRAQINALETQTGTANVTSPIDGIVRAKYASPGVVIAEKQPLFSITRIDPISVVFSLAPYEAKTVRTDMPITVRLRELPGESVTASITTIGSQINPATGRFDVKASIPNPNGVYKGGMSAQIEFSGAEKQKYFRIPAEALITDHRRHYVFTVSMGAAHRVPVILREIKGNKAEIIEGLVEGDIVVVKGNKELKEGTVVDIWGGR